MTDLTMFGYPQTARDWLAAWDAGDAVWTIEMGGIGPGYEQAIQATAAEIVRHLIATGYDHARWADAATWKADRALIDAAVSPVVSPLGLSGAQWGAAMQLATKFYMEGPVAALENPDLKDRHILVSRTMPTLATA